MNYNSVRLFYVEGQTEIHLIKNLKLRGKPKLFNFWTTNVNKIIRTIKSNYCVCIVYDTDSINSKNIIRFIDSINRIASSCYKVILLQQTDNLEDELKFSCSCKQNILFNAFNSSGRREFKSQFLKTSNPIEVLNKLGFNMENLWSKDIIADANQLIKKKNIYHGNVHLVP